MSFLSLGFFYLVPSYSLKPLFSLFLCLCLSLDFLLPLLALTISLSEASFLSLTHFYLFLSLPPLSLLYPLNPLWPTHMTCSFFNSQRLSLASRASLGMYVRQVQIEVQGSNKTSVGPVSRDPWGLSQDGWILERLNEDSVRCEGVGEPSGIYCQISSHSLWISN